MVTVAFDQESLSSYVADIYGYPLEVMSLIQACHAGDATQLADWLVTYFEAGVRSFVIRLASLDDPVGMVERFAAEVVPGISGR